MQESISVLLVDHHALCRDTLRDCLEREPDLHVVATAGDADEGVTKALEHRPDVVVMDVCTPGLLCFDAARTIRSILPSVRIIFLSAFCHRWDVEQALLVRCAGFVTKDERPEIIVAAIRAAASQQLYFSPDARAQIIIDREGVRLADAKDGCMSKLTQREKEALRYLAAGHSKKSTAALMHVSIKTVDRHATSLMRKLGIRNRVELALFAMRENLIQP